MTLGSVRSGSMYAKRPIPMEACNLRSEDFENTALSVIRVNAAIIRVTTSGGAVLSWYDKNFVVYLIMYLMKCAKLVV